MGGAVRRRENPFRKRIILIGFNSDHALGACDASLAKNFSTCAVELRSMTLKASPLSSRGYERSVYPRMAGVWVTSTLKESPIALLGHAYSCVPMVASQQSWSARATLAYPLPFSVLFSLFPLSVGPSDTTATER